MLNSRGSSNSWRSWIRQRNKRMKRGENKRLLERNRMQKDGKLKLKRRRLKLRGNV